MRRDNGALAARVAVAIVVACAIGFLFAAAFFLGGRAFGHHNAQHSWLSTWIPSTCCVTNDCCFEVTLADLEPLSNDRWLIKASGQIISRTDWSKDGRYWRCACTWQPDRSWRVHPAADTFCLFVPMPSS